MSVHTTTTSDVIAIGSAVSTLIGLIAATVLHSHRVPKDVVRATWVIVAVAALVTVVTIAYAVVSTAPPSGSGPAAASIPTAASAPTSQAALMAGSWSGSYTVNGASFELGMTIKSPGGDRLTAVISGTAGPLSGSFSMSGTCSTSEVVLSSSMGDLTGTPPANSGGAFTGTLDIGMSVSFSVTK